jgi:hypothetical protein
MYVCINHSTWSKSKVNMQRHHTSHIDMCVNVRNNEDHHVYMYTPDQSMQ